MRLLPMVLCWLMLCVIGLEGGEANLALWSLIIAFIIAFIAMFSPC